MHLGEVSILYGRFANSAEVLSGQPVLFALFDAAGPRPFVLTPRYEVQWEYELPGDSPPDTTRAARLVGPRTILLRATSGGDTLELRIDVDRHVASETGGGEQPLFRAEETARSFFIQMEGRARLTGTLDGDKINLSGHAYSETFRIDR